MKRHAKPLLLVILVGLLVSTAFVFPVRAWMFVALDWIDAHRDVAWILFIAIYIAAAVLFVPGSILALAGGFIFGLTLGVLLVSVGSVLGAVAALLVGRSLARAWVAKRIASTPRFLAIDRAVRRDGFMIVLLARLSPLIPYNMLNYALALTAVRLRDYTLASWIGMLPVTTLYVYIGTLANDLAALGTTRQHGVAMQALVVGGFVATIALTMLIARRAIRALAAELDASAEDRG